MEVSSSSVPVTSDRKVLVSFWFMGMLNNLSYVVMIAGAKDISDGGTALVFLANILPTLAVKFTSPLWFHLVSYSNRIYCCALFMTLSFFIVAFFASLRAIQGDDKIYGELFGVACGSFGSGMGEATLLAFAGKVGGSPSIAAYASGTGVSGVVGYLYFVTLNDWMKLPFTTTITIGSSIGVAYGAVYLFLLRRYEDYEMLADVTTCSSTITSKLDSSVSNDLSVELDDVAQANNERNRGESVFMEDRNISQLSTVEKSRLVLSLWPFMVPLFSVYAAEYAMQSGAWAAIGFPVVDEKKRDLFYEYAGWAYQAGVLLSRSSGFFISAAVRTLWIITLLQIILLFFFIMLAASARGILYNWWLIVPCFVVGLLGGFVYVQSFQNISTLVPRKYVEFSLSSASMADTFGIVAADILGIFIQSCLYEINGLAGAVASCPF